MILAFQALWNRQANCSTEQLLQLVEECGCGVLECRSSRFGDQQGCLAQVEGHWNQIAKLEDQLAGLGNQEQVAVSFARGSATDSKLTGLVPYSVDLFGADRKDILPAIMRFFQRHDIELEDMTSSRFFLMDQSNPILNAHFLVLIPAEQSLLGLRDEFLAYCDDLKVDALMEPNKR